MWNRKNFLIFALLLNCSYFIGTSILAARYVSSQNQRHLNYFVEAGSQAIIDKYILDIHHRNAFTNEFKGLDFVNEIRNWAALNNITNVVELEAKIATSWVGSREEVPFNRTQLKFIEDVGFYKNENYLNFAYFLLSNEKQFFITQQFDDSELLLRLDTFGIQMTIVEREGSETPRVLYTTLPKDIAEELTQKINFNAPQSSPGTATLSKEAYVFNTIQLIPHGPLAQRMLFTKKIGSYKLLTIDEVLIFIWTLFCVSIALNVALFKFTDR